MFRHGAPALLIAVVGCHEGDVAIHHGPARPTTEWPENERAVATDDPRQVRPSFGNDELHTWWPLTEPETAAVKDIDRARQGDVHALLALAILASGDTRDAASYAEYQQRIDRVVADLRHTQTAAADDWHRGSELNKAMHRLFFKPAKDKGDPDLGGYEVAQGRLTGIFATGKFNCLSSSLLYAVLARGLDLPVRAVVLPTHAFVELGAPGAKVYDVETTSVRGFDLVHDARFFATNAAAWSSNRGIKPTTLSEYEHRQVEPVYQLVAQSMTDVSAGGNEDDRKRLLEVATLLAPEDHDIQTNALGIYGNEANSLRDKSAWHTMVRMFKVVAPTLAALGSKITDPELLERLSWLRFYQAYALAVSRRPDEAIAIVNTGIDGLDPRWKDYDQLRQNYLSVLIERVTSLMRAKEYPAALELLKARFDLCKLDSQCSYNVAVIYHNQAVTFEQRGDVAAALAVLKECKRLLPNATMCADALAELEAR